MRPPCFKNLFSFPIISLLCVSSSPQLWLRLMPVLAPLNDAVSHISKQFCISRSFVCCCFSGSSAAVLSSPSRLFLPISAVSPVLETVAVSSATLTLIVSPGHLNLAVSSDTPTVAEATALVPMVCLLVPLLLVYFLRPKLLLCLLFSLLYS
jgi:hypothetical protein